MLEQRNSERVFCGDYIYSGILVLNISPYGALLAAEKKMEMGDTVVLPLRLGPVLRIELKAEVKWQKQTDSNAYAMGVAFEEPDSLQINRYVGFLKALDSLVA